MTTQAEGFKTAEQIRAEAAAEYEAANPRPTPPTPPVISRPDVIAIGDARAWIEIGADTRYSTRPTKAHVQFTIVCRTNAGDQSITGTLDPENLEALIKELDLAQDNIEAKSTYLTDDAEYGEQSRMWTNAKDEFARRREAEWQKAQKADGKK
jgi:hypothetical protein